MNIHEHTLISYNFDPVGYDKVAKMEPMYTLTECRAIELRLTACLSDSSAFLQTAPELRNAADLVVLTHNINNAYRDLEKVKLRVFPNIYQPLAISLRHASEELARLLSQPNDLDVKPSVGRQWQKVPGGGRKITLDMDLLRLLASMGFSDQEIGHHLNCSGATILRRRTKAGIKKRNHMTIDDRTLAEHIIYCLKWGNGTEGEVGVNAMLKSRGILVTREQLRSVLLAIGQRSRSTMAPPVVRRIYRVPWINALWHIDGHHKLIRWNIVIHGGIDGFSRMAVFMLASDNNRADTVEAAFRQAVSIYGLPSRVRADRGKENYGVRRLMEEARGTNRGSFIAGTSTHNQRIERLWVDLQNWCTRRYKSIFMELEEQRHLDVDNAYHMWALHFCYLPLLNRALSTFMDTWNCHGIRTANCRSPQQLWIQNRIKAAKDGMDLIRDPSTHPSDRCPQIQAETLQGFDTYGLYNGDDEGMERLYPSNPRDSDPYVRIPVFEDRIPASALALLSSPSFRAEMAVIAGPFDPMPSDWGKARYIRVMYAVSACVQGFDNVF